MRVILQCMCEASVSIDGKVIRAIGTGFVLLVGLTRGDTLEYVT